MNENNQNCEENENNNSVIIKPFDDNPLSWERNKRNIDEFYKDEENEIKNNLNILESLNSKLVDINKENHQDIEDLETNLQDYKAKNMNLAMNNQKILSAIEEKELNENELEEKLKELEKILELQENQKHFYINKVFYENMCI